MAIGMNDKKLKGPKNVDHIMDLPVNHSLGHEELHSFGNAVRKLVQVLGRQRLSNLPPV